MEYGNVQEKISDMVQRIYATESIVYMLASNMDKNVLDYQLEAAIGKVVASESKTTFLKPPSSFSRFCSKNCFRCLACVR
jgi:alkylation response protein AidB-like acyl-CoA dehydrogenase